MWGFGKHTFMNQFGGFKNVLVCLWFWCYGFNNLVSTQNQYRSVNWIEWFFNKLFGHFSFLLLCSNWDYRKSDVYAFSCFFFGFVKLQLLTSLKHKLFIKANLLNEQSISEVRYKLGFCQISSVSPRPDCESQFMHVFLFCVITASWHSSKTINQSFFVFLFIKCPFSPLVQRVCFQLQ